MSLLRLEDTPLGRTQIPEPSSVYPSYCLPRGPCYRLSATQITQAILVGSPLPYGLVSSFSLVYFRIFIAQRRGQEYICPSKGVSKGQWGMDWDCVEFLCLHTGQLTESQQGREDTPMEPFSVGMKNSILRYSKAGAGVGH